MKLLISTAFLAIQCCQFVQSSTDDHADDNHTSRVPKTLTKQFKTMPSIMKKHPVNTKYIYSLQTEKNFKSIHRGLEDIEGTQCEVDLFNIVHNSGFNELDAYLNGITITTDFSAYTWIGDESDLSELSDACADLGGSISLIDINAEGDQCDEEILYVPFCIPNSCTVEEALEVLNQDPPDDDYFDDDNGVDDCSYEVVLTKGPPENIPDSCFITIMRITVLGFDFLWMRELYSPDNGTIHNITKLCEVWDASVYFTKGETNGQCFDEILTELYKYQVEVEGWDSLPECIPNECTKEKALEVYKVVYTFDFESQPECVFTLEYTSPPDDETPEESPPNPDGPTSKAPKSMNSTKSSKAPKMVKTAKASKDEYKGLRSFLILR